MLVLNRSSLVRVTACGLVGTVLIFAALSKAEHVRPSAVAAAAIIGIDDPGRAGDVGIIALIIWEALLGLALWTSSGRDPIALRATAWTIGLFSAALVRQVIAPTGRSCGCGIAWDTLAGDQVGAGIGLLRNAAMLWLLRLASSEPNREPTDHHAGDTPAFARRAAFALVELLAAIAVIAVLLAIAIPVIRDARLRSHETRQFSDLRQAIAALGAYSQDYKDAWPYLQTPGNFNAAITVRGVQVGWSYFASGRTLWANLICPAYIDAPQVFLRGDLDALIASNIADGWEPSTIRSRILFADIAFAVSDWWATDDPPVGQTFFAGTRHADVVFPARKGALIDYPDASRQPPRVARADGSAEYLAPAHNPQSGLVERWLFGVPTRTVQSTRCGWRGIDPGL